jgi:formate dehydrogenase major subunit
VSPLEYLTPPAGHLILQTIRSHDQYNTTFYGLDDRYRGISNGRRVILINEDDVVQLGFHDRDMVDVISTFRGEERRADEFRLVVYPTPRGCAAAYFPEANALMHRELVARESNTPGYKAMAVRFIAHEPAAASAASVPRSA